MKIKHIVIVGGGSSGWLTALNFYQKTLDMKITVIATPDIPIIGVGESTTGKCNDIIGLKSGFFHIDEADFLRQTGSTYKMGIKHTDWREVGDSFMSPLGDEYLNDSFYPHETYDYYRIYHVAHQLKYVQQQAQFMLNDRLPFLWVDEDDPYVAEFDNKFGKIDAQFHHMAYHLNSYEVGQYIKNQVLSKSKGAVTYIEDRVVGVEKSEDGFIKSLVTQNGLNIKGDLFVDCSGFSRVLIGKEFENRFISYENDLLVNRAFPFRFDNDENTIIKNYTEAVAKKYGWMWKIPLQHRTGYGYVYDDNYITPDQAQEEIEKDLGRKIEPQSDLKFTPGRMENYWIKNLISTGLSSAFVEPLEATAIHMTIVQINFFIEQYYTPHLDFNCEELQKAYNRNIGAAWDDLRDFIVLHYISPRKDTEFWIESSSEDRWSDQIKDKMAVWKTRMPRLIDYKCGIGADNFYNLGNTLWYQILIGMDILDSELAMRELEGFDLMNKAKIDFENRKKFIEHLLSISTTNNDFYKKELRHFHEYYRVYSPVYA